MSEPTSIPDIPQRDEFFLDEHHLLNPVWLRFFQKVASVESEIIRDTFANIPTGLGTQDEGTMFQATDYNHTWRWDGTSWRYLDEGDRSGRIEFFLVAPTVGWKLMDGTGNPVTYTTETAAIATITLPNAVGAYLKGAAAPGTVQVAANPGGMTGALATENAHTHDPGTYFAPASAAVYAVNAGTAQNVSPVIHAHAITGLSGPGSAHTHGIGTLAPDGTAEPIRYGALPYFRL